MKTLTVNLDNRIIIDLIDGKSSTEKLSLGTFHLDNDNIDIRGFHNPNDLWNGWSKPRVTRQDVEDYCKRKGWTCTIFNGGVAINWNIHNEHYRDIFPLVWSNTFKFERAMLYDLSGWCWMEKGK